MRADVTRRSERAEVAHADEIRGDESIFQSDQRIQSYLSAGEHSFRIEKRSERRMRIRDGFFEQEVRHLFIHCGDQIALIVGGQSVEKRRALDDVGVSGDGERLGDLSREQNIEIAFLDARFVAFRPAEFWLSRCKTHQVVETDQTRCANSRAHQRSSAEKRTAVADLALAGHFRHTRSICVVHTLSPFREIRGERTTTPPQPVKATALPFVIGSTAVAVEWITPRSVFTFRIHEFPIGG